MEETSIQPGPESAVPAGNEPAVSAVVEVPAGHDAGHAEAATLHINPAPALMGLTWVTFIIMTVILYKVAWKPILAALASRENRIRQALDDAERTRAALEAAENSRREMLTAADRRGAEIVEQAKVAARDAAASIDAKAREDAQALLESARREITAATEKARSELRREAAGLAIELAGKIVGQNMDSAKNRELVNRLTG